jgi:hypothetical protein
MAVNVMSQIFAAVKAHDKVTGGADPHQARQGLDELGTSIKDLASHTKVTRVAVEVASKAIQGFQAGVKFFSDTATGGVGAAFALSTAITEVFTGPLKSVQQFASSIAPYVQAANPGVMLQFQIALLDTQAVVGGLLTPAMQGLTIYVRALGDSLAKLTPVLQPLFNAIGQFIANAAGRMGPLVEQLAPWVELFVDGLTRLVNWFSKYTGAFVGFVTGLMKALNGLLGITSSRYDKDATSKGAAVRSVGVSSVEQFAKDQFAKSTQGIMGYGKGEKPVELSADEINEKIGNGVKFVEVIAKAVKDIRDWVVKKQQQVDKADKVARTVSPLYDLLT